MGSHIYNEADNYEFGCSVSMIILLVALIVMIVDHYRAASNTDRKQYSRWVEQTGRDDVSFDEYKLIKQQIMETVE